MKRVGRGLHVVEGVVVVKAERKVDIGTPLFDRRGRKVGTVVDIIGRTDSPFLVVKGKLVDVYYRR